MGKRREWVTHAPWREYYKVRNRTYVVWHLMSSGKAKMFVLVRLFRQIVGAVLFDPEKLKRCQFMFKGFRDAIKGRLGIEVRPG